MWMFHVLNRCASYHAVVLIDLLDTRLVSPHPGVLSQNRNKIHRERPEAYDNTERMSLVCSFLASVLAGRYAEIETSDGSGMNLMHIR